MKQLIMSLSKFFNKQVENCIGWVGRRKVEWMDGQMDGWFSSVLQLWHLMDGRKVCGVGARAVKIVSRKNQGTGWLDGWMAGWKGGWMDGWMDGEAGLRIAYRNQRGLF